MAVQIDFQGLHSNVLAQRTLTYLAMGQIQQAEETLVYANTLSISEKSNCFFLRLLAWGEFYLVQHYANKARDCFLHVRSKASSDDIEIQVHILYGLARVAALQGEYQEALLKGSECLAQMEKMEYWQAEEVRAWLDQLPLVSVYATTDEKKKVFGK